MDENQLLAQFPPERAVDASDIAESVSRNGRVVIVLDDDPTGTQSVHDLPVLTSWREEDFDWALDQAPAAIYVMINSRSLAPADAERVNREVVDAATAAARRRSVALAFASRSDSTLRGHFPLEPDVIADQLVKVGEPRPRGVILAPAFPDAGRVTIGGDHWVRHNGELTPVASSEFAADSTFGYASSRLADWVEERSNGAILASSVVTLDLHTLRAGSQAVGDAILSAADGSVIAVDAVCEDDLRLLAQGLEMAESSGYRYIYRVGPPFVRAAIGQVPRAPLTLADIDPEDALPDRGGLIVVGSHVGLTSRQLTDLQAHRADVADFELDVTRILGGDADAAIEETSSAAIAAMQDRDVVVYTSRVLVRSDDPDESLAMSRRVSDALVQTVRRIASSEPPRFVIAKGGITSSDTASKGLEIGRARVLGPMLPGIVSLWRPADGIAVGIPYIVFAGNVGDGQSLTAVVNTLSVFPRKERT